MISYGFLLSLGHFSYSLIRFRVQTRKLLYVLIRSVVFVIVYRVEFITFCQSFIVFLVREGVTVRNLKTDSNSELEAWIRPKNVRGAQGRQALAKGHFGRSPWGAREAHGPHTPIPHEAHTPLMGWWCGSLPLAMKIPSLSPSLSLSLLNINFPSHFISRRKIENIYAEFFSPTFSPSKHYNFLIQTSNWVIQVGEVS